MEYMEKANKLVFMKSTLILCCLTLIFLIIFIKRRKLLKRNTIKEYLKEYLEKYSNNQFVELDIKILPAETQKVASKLGVVSVIALGLGIRPITSFIRYFAPDIIKDIFIELWIFTFGTFAILGIIPMKFPGVKKIRLKNNVIELHNSNNEIKSYQLEKINIKYNMETRRNSVCINIFFNDVEYASRLYGLQNYTPYIAFVIFLNLLKRNELEKINNLNDEDIRRLQQDIKYN